MKKIKTAIELEAEIQKSKKLLYDDSYEYLCSILNLKQSILYNYSAYMEYEKLFNSLDFFNDLALYNIYNKALSLITHKQKDYKICGNINNKLISIITLGSPVFELECNNEIKVYLYSSMLDKNLYLNIEREYMRKGILLMNNLDEEKDFITCNENNKEIKVKTYSFADIIIK